MKSNYRRIGDFIELVDVRNKELKVKTLLGLSISKQFIPSVANTVGTNMKNYKIIKKNQFACSIMQVRRDRKMPVALLKDFDEAIISQAYPVFEITKIEELLPDYLMMWFTRSEFDRHAEFLAVGGVRGSLEWEDFLEMTLPVPSLKKQQEIVHDYNTVQDRIRINEQLNTALEETAQAIYKHWFVDFQFPIEFASSNASSSESRERLDIDKAASSPQDLHPTRATRGMHEEKLGYKSSGGAMVYNEELDQEIPLGWEVKKLHEITSVLNGRAYKQTEFVEKGTQIIRIQNLNGGSNFVYSDMKLEENKYVNENDLIFAWSATFGPFIWRGEKSIYHYHIWKLECYNQDFKFLLYHYLLRETRRVSSEGSGSIFRHITKSLMESQTMILPNEMMIVKFDEFSKRIDKQISDNLKMNLQLSEYSKILLSKMATVVDGKELVLNKNRNIVT